MAPIIMGTFTAGIITWGTTITAGTITDDASRLMTGNNEHGTG